MKEKDARSEGGHKMIVYVEKDDHTYGPLQTGSYMVSHYYDDFADKQSRLEESCFRKLKEGSISPVAYYMTLVNIAEADLASRVGISRRRLKKHLTPAGFERMDLVTAGKYAEIFGIPVANLFQVLQAESSDIVLTQDATGQPLVTLTRAGLSRK